jgi:predicted RNA-binding protein YlxR (DUF448 family)
MGGGSVHMPVRTCVGCRERAAQPDLLRVVLTRGRLVADARRRLPGRGSYIHPTAGCVRRASERGGFARSFRAQLAPPVVLENAEGLIHDDWGREEQRS